MFQSTLEFEWILPLIPHWKSLNRRPFFGGYRCTTDGAEAPRAQGTMRQSWESGSWVTWLLSFPSDCDFVKPPFAKEGLVDKLEGLPVEMCFVCGNVDEVQFFFSPEMWYFVGYLLVALEIGSDFIWSRSEIWVCTLKCGRCCSRSAGSIQHSSTFRDDVCLRSDRTKIWKPTPSP